MRPTLPWLTVITAWLGTALGCASILGIDEFLDSDAGLGGQGAEAGGAGGQGAGIGTEDCLDGVDNTGDRLADCEDPLCAATHECASPAPAGWIGIGWIDEHAPFEDCPADHRIELFDEGDLHVPTASCECTCGEPVVVCEAAAKCGNTCKGTSPSTAFVGDACSNLDVATGEPRQCWADTLRASASACEPEGALVASAPTWAPAAIACLYSAPGHCGGTEECVPRAPASAKGPCVATTGDEPCPTSYPNRTSYWDGVFADTRVCDVGQCSCDPPQGMNCACTGSPCGMQIFPYGGCSAASSGVLAMDGGCVLTSALSGGGHHVGFQLVGYSVSALGACAPSGTAGDLTGVVAATQLVTVCCQIPTAGRSP